MNKPKYCQFIDLLEKGYCSQCLYWNNCDEPDRIKNHTDGTAWKLEMMLKYLEWKYPNENKDVQRSESELSGNVIEYVDGEGKDKIC